MRFSSPIYRQDQSGFTLVELLLALLMFGIVTSAIFAAFAAISSGVESGRHRTETSHIGRTAMQKLTQEIASAYRLQNSECLEDKPSYFCKPLKGDNESVDSVDRDRIMFLSIPVQRFPEKVPRGELCDICYFIDKNDFGETALFRSEDCTLGEEKDDERCPVEGGVELTDAIVGMNFTYFGATEDQDEPEPAETWPPEDNENADGTLPCRVRVELIMREARPGEILTTMVALPMRGQCEVEAN